jgi:aminopeptidase N
MQIRGCGCVAGILALGLVWVSNAADGIGEAWERVDAARWVGVEKAVESRRYAPDRDEQVLHLRLEITPDFQKREIEGRAAYKLRPFVKPLAEVRLDAVDMVISKVTSSEPIRAWRMADDQVLVTFAGEIPPGREFTLEFQYHAEPTQGIYFRTPEMGYKAGDTHLFSQGETIEARHWYPSFDSPNRKFTSEVICAVPEGMTVISNGRLVSQEKDVSRNLVVFHWSQEAPSANYLIDLVAGYFKKVEGRHGNVPLAFYTPPSEFEQAALSFHHTEDIMAFFDEEIGVPYPWPKYDQVCVDDFVAGGMENTSATTLTTHTLHPPTTGRFNDSDGLVAHEMAHQWFGDYVTCKDWSDTWLNEGSATYYALLYEGHRNGRDAMLYGFYRDAKGITGIENDTDPIVRHDYARTMDMFGLVYPKGSWVLRMLRADLGDELFRKVIRTYLERHAHGSVVTEDLRAVAEELSGRSYDQFFDQWVYHAHHPEIEANYDWDERTGLAKVSIRQTQKVDAKVLAFNFPLTIRFKGAFGAVDKRIVVREKPEDFYFKLDSAPRTVRLDPDLMLLAKISFSPPRLMLEAQLEDRDDVIGRLIAVEKLSREHDHAAVEKLKRVLQGDGFHGVREEAARGLRGIHTDEALEALIASIDQDDERVRSQVAEGLAGFYSDKALAAAKMILARETNPIVAGSAVDALAAYGAAETRDLLLRRLAETTHHNRTESAAIRTMRAQDDPTYLAPLMAAAGDRAGEFTTSTLSQMLGAIGHLARNEDQKAPVREFLEARLRHKKDSVRVAAIRALGELGDPRAVAVLETFARAGKGGSEQEAASRAVEELRKGRKPVDDFKQLREETLQLKKETKELREKLEALQKKLDAQGAPAGVKAKAPGKPGRRE